MAYRNDIQLVDGDLNVINSDLQIVESDYQHIVDTINANAGTWKENVNDGVGINNYLKGVGIENELARSIKLQLTNDKYISRPIIGYDQTGTLIIDPNVEL